MKERIITGVLAAVVFLPIVFIGGVWFYSVMALLAAIGLRELLRMKGFKLKHIPGMISLLMVILLVIPKNFWDLPYDIDTVKMYTIIIGMFSLLTWTVITKNLFTFEDASFVIMSTLYVGIGFLYFNETRALEDGIGTLFFVLFIVWATDSGAYFFGKSFGKRKLWPVISPNKTIEGSLGGLLCAIIVAIIFQAIFPIYPGFILPVVAAVVIGIFGQIGDLVESAFKRHYEIKDSGTLLPGHGGILDRFDSILFVLPILHIMQLVA